MKGSEEYLYNFMEGRRKRFVIPVYQRNYNWKREQCKKLFDDLVDVHRNDKKSHFFGSIVSVNEDNKTFTIIDGQQRITTISLIMIAMINAVKNGEFDGETDVKTCKRIREDFIVAEDDDVNKLRLRPYNDDKVAFSSLVFDTEDKYKQESNVTVNYKYFYDRIVKNRELSLPDLSDAIEKLQIISIELKPDQGDDPQLIFESLNSTGLALEESDKIRNYILMGRPADEQEHLYRNYWYKIETLARNHLEDFIFNYLMIHTGKVKSSQIYKAFKDYAKGRNNESILSDLLKYATIFNKLITHDLDDTEANRIKERIDRLNITTPTPFLMSFFDLYVEKQWPKEELRTVLLVIESYLLRRTVCGYQTNALRSMFAGLHQRILRLIGTSAISYSSVMIYLLKNMSTTFPNDELFKQSFGENAIYELRPYIRSYILDRLERKDNEETINVFEKLQSVQKNERRFSVEHIMPQTLNEAWINELGGNLAEATAIHDKWVHTIANLTVTAYNSELSNSSFAFKKERVYNDSTLHLNDFVRSKEHWTEDELKERRDLLVKDALALWPYPDTDYMPATAVSQQVTLDDDDYDFTFKQLSSISFLEVEYRKPHLEWKTAVVWVLQQLFDLDPQPLFDLANDPSESYIVADKADNSTKIADNVYVFLNTDTNTKVRLLRRVAEKYHLNEGDVTDDIIFTLKPQEE